jgi:polysaccharide export outer membrane protein
MLITKKIFFFFLLQVLIAACIPNRKLIYLQDQKADLEPKNSVVKSFPLKNTDYKLKPGDIISAEVFSLTQEKFNFLGAPKLELNVDSQGNVELPVVGSLQVAGLTLQETQEKMKNLTTEYLKNPKISVKLINFNFTILGEVEAQGKYTVTNAKLSILEALGIAGGLTDYADRARIRIVRQEKDNANIVYIDLLEDNILLSENYFLQPNDVVMVDPLKAKNTRQQQLGTASLVFSLVTSVAFLLTQILR